MEMLIKVSSSEKGKCCDLFPPNSIHKVERDNKGLRCIDRGSSWVYDFVEYVIINKDTKTKKCPKCKCNFTEDTRFISSNQTGDTDEVCLVCYEKRNVTGDRYQYRQALREQILQEFEDDISRNTNI